MTGAEREEKRGEDGPRSLSARKGVLKMGKEERTTTATTTATTSADDVFIYIFY